MRRFEMRNNEIGLIEDAGRDEESDSSLMVDESVEVISINTLSGSYFYFY